MTEMEEESYPDALSFLESLKDVYPAVESVLGTHQLKALDVDIGLEIRSHYTL